MRLPLVIAFVVLVLIVAICESKSTKKHSEKSKNHAVKKSSKPSKENHSKTSNAKHGSKKSKAAEKIGKIPKLKKEKTSDSKAKSSHKIKDKTTESKTTSKSKDKTEKNSNNSLIAKSDSKSPKENLKTIPSNCDVIVQQYADGKLVMYEYKIKMARCLKGKIDKKSVVPQTDVANVQNSMDSGVPQQQTASYYPSQDQSNLDQTQAPAQTEAAFSQNTMYNQMQTAPAQQDYNYYTRSNIPAAPQNQNANQWNAPNAAPAQNQVDATKKDTLPAAPSDDPFAQFMNIQSSPDTAPQAIQQRSDIPSAQPQVPQSYMPVNQQAYFREQVRAWSPEDDGIFPENP